MNFAPSAISLVGTGAQNISPPSERAIRDGLARSLCSRIPFSPQKWTTSMEDYHEVTCPGGVYRLEFFGPRMDEEGYQIKGGEESRRESMWEAIR